MKVSTMVMAIRSFFTKKRIIWTVILVVLLFGGWLIFGPKSNTKNIQVGKVKREDIQKTVLTTGQVVSSIDLNLSLQSSGVVRQVSVKEGDLVGAGQTLVVLDQSNALASLQSAEASLSQAEANFNKTSAAATLQDIGVSQASVDSAQTTLDNAKQNLIRDLNNAYNNINSAVLSNTNNLFSNPQSSFPQFGIAGTVQTNQQLVNDANGKRVDVNSILDKWQTEILTLDENNIDQVLADSINNITVVRSYLNNLLSLITTYTQVSTTAGQAALASAQSAVTVAKTTIDTTNTTITSDGQAVKSAKSSLDQARASLALKKAPARQEDVDIAKAQVSSAEGAVQAAKANLNNTVLRAPVSGTITLVDIKIGEQAQVSKVIMKLLNVTELHTEALVSEADIASVVVGQSVDNTFDALGPEKHFTTTVLTVNPASTVISGVVNYKVTGSLEKIPEVKPGMTANMTIKVAEKKAVLVAPSSAIINKNNGRYVKVVDDPKKKTYHEVEVQTGLEGDGGQTEIVSGLSEGQEIVTFMK